MKKFFFILAVIATAMLASCEREQSFENLTPLGENGVAFVIKNASTRSSKAVCDASVKTGVSIPMGKFSTGEALYLEETIEDLNPNPSTKGAPAYTQNVGTLYKTMGVYSTTTSFGDAVFDVMDMYDHIVDDVPDSGLGWRYNYLYDTNPWPTGDAKDTDVDFYLRMPSDMAGISDAGFDYTDGVISFNYTSPFNGSAQQDIIFAKTTLKESVYRNNYSTTGAPVTMYHALTGVKFRNGHSNDGSTKTIITGVKFKGLWSTGDCTVTLGDDGTTVEWEQLNDAATFTLNFDNPTYDPDSGADNPDGTVSYGTAEGDITSFNGTSWVTAAADHNLNDEDGSLTFWFIPQRIDENVTLEVTFLVKTPDTPNGTEITHTIDFGKLVTKTTGEGESATTTYTDWKAGQLRTYTLKPFDVDVEIFDSVTNLTKDNLHVTNTGNVDEYVRAMVIGNWYGWKTAEEKESGVEPSIMVGYQYVSAAAAAAAGETDDPMVEPWYRENPVYAAGFDETFPGGRPLASSHWKRGTGSYFYYDLVIGAGQQLSGTDALFQHYELEEDMIPTIYIPVANQTTRVAAVGVHLVMEVVVQAIPTTKPDGTTFASCWEAWSYAVGKEIKAK